MGILLDNFLTGTYAEGIFFIIGVVIAPIGFLVGLIGSIVFFVKKSVYDQYGCFNTSFRIAADYEIMVRFLERNRISTFYIDKVLVKMRTGGTSNRSLRNILLKSTEDYRARKENNVNNAFSTLLLKNLSKIPQFLGRKSKDYGLGIKD